LTQQSQQFCTFFVDGHYFGVPVQQVQEVLRYQEMTEVPLVSSVIRGLINLRGQIITAVDLRRQLGMDDRPEKQKPMNVIMRTDEGAFSLLVDEIGDVIEVEETTFEPPPDTLQGMAKGMLRGVYKLPARLLLVLDTQQAANGSGTDPRQKAGTRGETS
jgi:purine-binding chemotaxis protein CheW